MNENDFATHNFTMGFTTNTSSCIAKFTYTSDSYYGQQGDVEVTFANGTVYYYKGVYSSDALPVIMAYHDEESVGRAYNTHIKNVYTVCKWDDLMDCAVWVRKSSIYASL